MEKLAAIPSDEKWSESKQRCWDLLVCFVGSEHRLQDVYHYGDGLQMNTWQELATFDSDLLTRLVVLAHRDHCRVSVGQSRTGLVAVNVWACQPMGNTTAANSRLCERHPGLDDLIAMAEQAKRAKP